MESMVAPINCLSLCVNEERSSLGLLRVDDMVDDDNEVGDCHDGGRTISLEVEETDGGKNRLAATEVDVDVNGAEEGTERVDEAEEEEEDGDLRVEELFLRRGEDADVDDDDDDE